jgi:uncharacterized protein (TIGR04255 family)
MLATMVVDDSPAMTYDLQSSFPTLQNAPITEALIDIQVQLPPDVDLVQLRKFHDGLEHQFPQIEERIQVSAVVKMDPLSGAEMKSDGPMPDGWLMRSETDALLAQVRLNGLTLSKLPPYITWKSLSDHAKELWHRYVQIARPIKVTKLAARYVNKIEMSPGLDFKESILTVPEIAPGIPQGLPEYFMRLVIPHPSGSIAIVTEASLPTPQGGTPATLFDIDVFRVIELGAADYSGIWSILEELRAYKNVIFFNTVTPKQLEKYK